MVLMIDGDLWKTLVVETYTSTDKKIAYFGDFVFHVLLL